MQPFAGDQRPDLLTSLMNRSLVLRLPREMHLSRSFSNVPRLPSFLKLLQNLHVLLTFGYFWQGGESLAPATQNNASRSKSGANIWCFAHFDFDMCLAPQQRHFLNMSTSKSAPRLMCFVHFDHWKTQCVATCLRFRAPGSSFFWDFLFIDLLSASLLFSDSAHLCFIVGSLTSKLPSVIVYTHEQSHQIANKHAMCKATYKC